VRGNRTNFRSELKLHDINVVKMPRQFVMPEVLEYRRRRKARYNTAKRFATMPLIEYPAAKTTIDAAKKNKDYENYGIEYGIPSWFWKQREAKKSAKKSAKKHSVVRTLLF
jgi:hypothetical protein